MTSRLIDALVDAGMSEIAARQKIRLFDRLDRELPNGVTARWFVPGRIEVLGKHTDYAGGRSLLCTADRGFAVAVAPRTDRNVRIVDAIRGSTFEAPLSADLEVSGSDWTVYPAVVARRVARDFAGALAGADIVLASDLPVAAGMSSSSALVVAIFTAVSFVNRLHERRSYTENIHSVEDLAGYLGCLENGLPFKGLAGDGGVGTFGGSEDQTAILACERGHLKQYSYCPVRWERTVRLPHDWTFVVAVSGVTASKIGSALAQYNRASQATRTILEIWRARSGSGATTLAAAATGSPDAPELIRAALDETDSDSRWLRNRFEQFWTESEVILPRATEALAREDVRTFGDLVDQSQAGAEQLLGNQIPETIFLAREARALGAAAASAFGAGFGGSVWALVRCDETEAFSRAWRSAYERSAHRASRASEFFVTPAAPPLIRI